MTIVRLLIIILGSLLAVARADSAAEPALLRSGDIIVTGPELQQFLLLLPETTRAETLASPEALKIFLSKIYQAKYIATEAERQGLDQTPKVQAYLMLQQRQVLAEALREKTREQIAAPDFTQLAREQYAVRRDEFQLPEQFKVAHILKKARCDCEKAAQRQKIEQLRTRLQAGEDFATLAKAESEDIGSAANGGALAGWVKREQLVAPFAEAMSQLKPGQLSAVVETEFGFHLIKLVDHQPARQQTFEEVQPTLEQQLRKTYVQDQLDKKALTYLPGPDAKFDDSALDAVLRDQAPAQASSPPAPAVKIPDGFPNKGQ
ncbi:MAG TPA: peptidylprolyl isomerase [Candidatus Competibacteraceae bacterium]|nr:peptidylprolyl isomerase [Candidatus Competibacteraceae bacterium]